MRIAIGAWESALEDALHESDPIMAETKIRIAEEAIVDRIHDSFNDPGSWPGGREVRDRGHPRIEGEITNEATWKLRRLFSKIQSGRIFGRTYRTDVELTIGGLKVSPLILD